MPEIIQCDQGTEFKGQVTKLLRRRKVKVIRSSAYHPQSQGKCERSHRDVRKKIHYKMGQKGGFNWAQNLFEIQEAINLIPKDVLGKRTPSKVYAARSNATMQQEVQAASQRSSDRMTKRLSKHLHLSVYRKGEHVLLKFPTGGSRLAPRRRYTCKGVVEERNLVQNKYKVRFVRPNGTKDSQWMSVSNITSVTVRKEKQAAKRTVSEELRKDQHRQKYCIPVTHKDN